MSILPEWRKGPVLAGAITVALLLYLWVRLGCAWGFADGTAYRAEISKGKAGSSFAATIQDTKRPWWLIGNPKAFGRAKGSRTVVVLNAVNPLNYPAIAVAWIPLWVESWFRGVFVVMG